MTKLEDIADERVKAAFMKIPRIQSLSEEERERLWERQQAILKSFRERVAHKNSGPSHEGNSR